MLEVSEEVFIDVYPRVRREAERRIIEHLLLPRYAVSVFDGYLDTYNTYW